MSIERAIDLAGMIPPDAEKQSVKKAYSELLSRELAFETAELLRRKAIFRKICPVRPSVEVRGSAEKRLRALNKQSPEKSFLGGFGRKKIDVSLADEQDGLLLALSIKTITSRDARSKNYNKNFKNRFGDLCAEAASVHMRSPFTVMCGLFAMPAAAAFDETPRRRPTAVRAIKYLRSIGGRSSHEQSGERFESLVFMLFDPVLQTGTEQEAHCDRFVYSGEPRDDFAGARYRLFDVWEQKEISTEEYVNQIERVFLTRNPFLED